MRQGAGIRGPAARRWLSLGGIAVPMAALRRLPPFPAATRAVASLLVLGSGLFYLAVAVKGVGWLFGPPPELVTMARDLGSGAPPADDPWSANGDLEVLFRPLAVTGASLAALLLLWAGARGLRYRNDQRRWRKPQITGLGGLVIGVLGFAIGCAATGSSPAPYVDASWIGLDPTWPSAVLALLIGAIALLFPARGSGRHRPTTSPGDRDQRGHDQRGQDGHHPAPRPKDGHPPAGLCAAPLAPAARTTIEARPR
jgi:hypothetical protein